jgi:integrase
MAIIRKRGNTWHIQWFEALEKKIHCETTGLKATEANRKKVEKYAKDLQLELSRNTSALKQIGIKKITIRDAFEHFLRNNSHKHHKTIKNYKVFYKLFTEQFDEDSSCNVISKIEVESFIGDLRKKPWQPNTAHTYVTHCIHFLNFLFEYNYTQMFKINREVRTRPEVKEKLVFTVEDVQKIFSNLSEKNLNFKVLINVLFYTGLRSSDVLSISSEKINLKNRSFVYYSPKRKIYREIGFHNKLLPIFKLALKNNNNGKLVAYKSVENLGRAINRYFKKLVIADKGYSARTFRKTFISLARSKYNMDASIVMELVGHAHGNTTDKYYNQISIDTMRKELRKFKIPTK